MARGRFISSAIITDRQIHDLSSDTCRLAYTWMISLADREGRVVGEPDLLLAQLFPRRLGEITPDDIEGFIHEWVQAGFVIWYEGKDGDRVLQLVNFEKHQVGLRKERETASSFDNPEDCRIIDGELSEQSPVKLIKEEVKLSESPKTDLFESCKRIYEQKKGLLVTDGMAFTQMINKFEKVGVTADDYAAAINAMDANPKYNGKKPTSYEKWAIGYAENRKDNGKEWPASDPNKIYKGSDGNLYNAKGEVIGQWQK